MTLENLLSRVGMGQKQLTDRYSEYGGPMPNPHVYDAYEPPVIHQPAPVAMASSKYHSSGSGGSKSNASMSALTLLAFLFFLHILQQCIKEHMTEMSQTPVIVMTGGREGEVDLSKSDKMDKTGEVKDSDDFRGDVYERHELKVNPFRNEPENKMMRINAAEHSPRNDYEYGYSNKNAKTSIPGFVSAMNEEEIK